MYYYLNRTENETIRIPKFLYHQLVINHLYLIIPKNIIYPENDTNEQQNLSNSTETPDSQRLKNQFTGNYHSYNSGNHY